MSLSAVGLLLFRPFFSLLLDGEGLFALCGDLEDFRFLLFGDAHVFAAYCDLIRGYLCDSLGECVVVLSLSGSESFWLSNKTTLRWRCI